MMFVQVCLMYVCTYVYKNKDCRFTYLHFPRVLFVNDYLTNETQKYTNFLRTKNITAPFFASHTRLCPHKENVCDIYIYFITRFTLRYIVMRTGTKRKRKILRKKRHMKKKTLFRFIVSSRENRTEKEAFSACENFYPISVFLK